MFEKNERYFWKACDENILKLGRVNNRRGEQRVGGWTMDKAG